VITVLSIQHEVAYEHGLVVKDLRGWSRTKRTSLARHVAMYLARALTPLSYHEIGAAFGGRDHTSVMSAVQKVERLWETDGEMAGTIDGLCAILEGTL
jgi:chromosomal replication initiator protein